MVVRSFTYVVGRALCDLHSSLRANSEPWPAVILDRRLLLTSIHRSFKLAKFTHLRWEMFPGLTPTAYPCRTTRRQAIPWGISEWLSSPSIYALENLEIDYKRLPRSEASLTYHKTESYMTLSRHDFQSLKMTTQICFEDLLLMTLSFSWDHRNGCKQVLEQLTGQQPVFGKARYTVRTFGIRRNERISTSVTIRGEKALSLIVSLCQPHIHPSLHYFLGLQRPRFAIETCNNTINDSIAVAVCFRRQAWRSRNMSSWGKTLQTVEISVRSNPYNLPRMALDRSDTMPDSYCSPPQSFRVHLASFTILCLQDLVSMSTLIWASNMIHRLASMVGKYTGFERPVCGACSFVLQIQF